MKKNLFQISNNETGYEIRSKEVNGINYWIVPVVMMVEGVHSGSRGPMLYTTEELAASVGAWNGVPVTIAHPQNDEGKYISANTPGVLSDIVGRIYHPKMKGEKLTAEAWIDVNALSNRSEEAFEYIKEKKALEVSVGVFSEEVSHAGEYEGEEYRAEAVNLIPDHLALLPGEVGACSWSDGCGIRTNSKNKMKVKTKTEKEPSSIPKEEWLGALNEQGCAIHFIDNEASLGEKLSAVQGQLNAMDSPLQVYYLEECYDDYVVYCVVNRETRERTMYKRNYVVSQEGKVVFRGEPTQVRKEVSFINMNKHTRTNFNKSKTEVKMKMKTNGKCTCSVDSLIENQATQFTEDDREWLTAMSQEQLNKLAPKEVEEETPTVSGKKVTKVVANKNKEEEEEVEEKGEALIKKGKDGSISINGKSLGAYIKEELAKEEDPNTFIDNFMPAGLGDQMKAGLKMYQNRRTKQIKEIAANSKFKEAQLKTWSDEDLAALHETVVTEEEEVRGNYAALGGGGLEEGEESEAPEDELSAMMSFTPTVKEAPAKKEAGKK